MSIVIFGLGLFSSILLNSNNTLEFGKELGMVNNVVAYSSYNKDKNLEKNYIKMNNKFILTGLKWQCVEFARRYLILNSNITFNEVDWAYQIFDLNNFITLDNKIINIQKCVNGSNNIPKEGSLLIWDKYVDINCTGHVAIIVKVNNDNIMIAEQNRDNIKWNNNYSRNINIEYNDNKFIILDNNIIGWINYSSVSFSLQSNDN
jgi:hypothetical protein